MLVLGNATFYVPMVAKEMPKWKLASEGELNFFAQFCYAAYTT
jgi:hypothetical protein